jgi:hypothetical protein
MGNYAAKAVITLVADALVWTPVPVYAPQLKASMAEAGFTQIRQYAAGESEDPVLKAIDFGPRTEYRDVNQYEAMAIEAVRP